MIRKNFIILVLFFTIYSGIAKSITPESLEEAIKEPATKKVARSTKK